MSEQLKNVLNKISELAIKYKTAHFTPEQKSNRWLGRTPATAEMIGAAEKRIGLALPEDYKAFLSITNGFEAPNQVESDFESLDDIGYLKDIDPELLNLPDIPAELKNAILVSGKNDEQYFLLIPPDHAEGKWKYWKFANWHPGEIEFENLEAYFRDVLEFIQEEIGK